ncbi:hypothetical protein EJ08DRAFT_11984 [Tothia fuscella]|uniref:Uncharacterized protein n=1 Tax=Tothia fuscella TaxID=1048955 RepID=A0A9P4P490_9PEZI|nr:hypothetical protein EJ08DRAFT_11984 [Tothia fuscella]
MVRLRSLSLVSSNAMISSAIVLPIGEQELSIAVSQTPHEAEDSASSSRVNSQPPHCLPGIDGWSQSVTSIIIQHIPG